MSYQRGRYVGAPTGYSNLRWCVHDDDVRINDVFNKFILGSIMRNTGDGVVSPRLENVKTYYQRNKNKFVHLYKEKKIKMFLVDIENKENIPPVDDKAWSHGRHFSLLQTKDVISHPIIVQPEAQKIASFEQRFVPAFPDEAKDYMCMSCFSVVDPTKKCCEICAGDNIFYHGDGNLGCHFLKDLPKAACTIQRFARNIIKKNHEMKLFHPLAIGKPKNVNNVCYEMFDLSEKEFICGHTGYAYYKDIVKAIQRGTLKNDGTWRDGDNNKYCMYELPAAAIDDKYYEKVFTECEDYYIGRPNDRWVRYSIHMNPDSTKLYIWPANIYNHDEYIWTYFENVEDAEDEDKKWKWTYKNSIKEHNYNLEHSYKFAPDRRLFCWSRDVCDFEMVFDLIPKTKYLPDDVYKLYKRGLRDYNNPGALQEKYLTRTMYGMISTAAAQSEDVMKKIYEQNFDTDQRFYFNYRDRVLKQLQAENEDFYREYDDGCTCDLNSEFSQPGSCPACLSKARLQHGDELVLQKTKNGDHDHVVLNYINLWDHKKQLRLPAPKRLTRTMAQSFNRSLNHLPATLDFIAPPTIPATLFDTDIASNIAVKKPRQMIMFDYLISHTNADGVALQATEVVVDEDPLAVPEFKISEQRIVELWNILHHTWKFNQMVIQANYIDRPRKISNENILLGYEVRYFLKPLNTIGSSNKRKRDEGTYEDWMALNPFDFDDFKLKFNITPDRLQHEIHVELYVHEMLKQPEDKRKKIAIDTTRMYRRLTDQTSEVSEGPCQTRQFEEDDIYMKCDEIIGDDNISGFNFPMATYLMPQYPNGSRLEPDMDSDYFRKELKLYDQMKLLFNDYLFEFQGYWNILLCKHPQHEFQPAEKKLLELFQDEHTKQWIKFESLESVQVLQKLVRLFFPVVGIHRDYRKFVTQEIRFNERPLRRNQIYNQHTDDATIVDALWIALRRIKDQFSRLRLRMDTVKLSAERTVKKAKTFQSEGRGQNEDELPNTSDSEGNCQKMTTLEAVAVIQTWFKNLVLKCPICFEFHRKAKTTTLSCNHTFCRDCFDKWTDTNFLTSKSCPCCRHPISDKYISKPTVNMWSITGSWPPLPRELPSYQDSDDELSSDDEMPELELVASPSTWYNRHRVTQIGSYPLSYSLSADVSRRLNFLNIEIDDEHMEPDSQDDEPIHEEPELPSISIVLPLSTRQMLDINREIMNTVSIPEFQVLEDHLKALQLEAVSIPQFISLEDQLKALHVHASNGRGSNRGIQMLETSDANGNEQMMHLTSSFSIGKDGKKVNKKTGDEYNSCDDENEYDMNDGFVVANGQDTQPDSQGSFKSDVSNECDRDSFDELSNSSLSNTSWDNDENDASIRNVDFSNVRRSSRRNISKVNYAEQEAAAFKAVEDLENEDDKVWVVEKIQAMWRGFKVRKNNKAISIRTGSIYKADESVTDKSVALTAMDVMKTTDSNEKKYQALLDYCNDYTDFVHEASETKDYDELKAMLLDCDPIIQGNEDQLNKAVEHYMKKRNKKRDRNSPANSPAKKPAAKKQKSILTEEDSKYMEKGLTELKTIADEEAATAVYLNNNNMKTIKLTGDFGMESYEIMTVEPYRIKVYYNKGYIPNNSTVVIKMRRYVHTFEGSSVVGFTAVTENAELVRVKSNSNQYSFETQLPHSKLQYNFANTEIQSIELIEPKEEQKTPEDEGSSSSAVSVKSSIYNIEDVALLNTKNFLEPTKIGLSEKYKRWSVKDFMEFMKIHNERLDPYCLDKDVIVQYPTKTKFLGGLVRAVLNDPKLWEIPVWFLRLYHGNYEYLIEELYGVQRYELTSDEAYKEQMNRAKQYMFVDNAFEYVLGSEDEDAPLPLQDRYLPLIHALIEEGMIVHRNILGTLLMNVSLITKRKQSFSQYEDDCSKTLYYFMHTLSPFMFDRWWEQKKVKQMLQRADCNTLALAALNAAFPNINITKRNIDTVEEKFIDLDSVCVNKSQSVDLQDLRKVRHTVFLEILRKWKHDKCHKAEFAYDLFWEKRRFIYDLGTEKEFNAFRAFKVNLKDLKKSSLHRIMHYINHYYMNQI